MNEKNYDEEERGKLRRGGIFFFSFSTASTRLVIAVAVIEAINSIRTHGRRSLF